MLNPIRRATRWTIALLLLLLAAAGCQNGGECDKCETDSECSGGLVCRNFLDDGGQVVDRRCGSGLGATTCRKP